ncbi:MAG: hydrolase [Lactobacillus sp.]|nr:hydrolase [Lactobacillus sp.]MCH3905578.1 hydrolase [Lactobacillus sp.]MCI1884258.1 hydrolase [Lactobacillus sp.]MCI1916648.1 hydrolase [Lactobacillus sp.]
MTILLTAGSLLTATPVLAATNSDSELKVSKELVKDTLKPQSIEQAFTAKEKAKATQEKLNEIKAEQNRLDQIAAQEQRAAQAKAQAAQKQTNQQSNVSGINKGTFKLSFYDPAVLGSNLGYGGVAANLSVFPKGTRLKITLSDGTVWYRTVNDTGTFAASNPRQLDVAMPNSQVPAAGILYATVEVLS